MSSPGLRERRRASSEAAILDAAWVLYSSVGPDGASLREVAGLAGCTHGLVQRYYGSKRGLVEAVGRRLTEQVAHTVAQAHSIDIETLSDLVRAARAHPLATRLLIRCALGYLQPAGFPACLGAHRLLPGGDALTAAAGPAVDRRSLLCVYGASSLLLGWVSFDRFVIAATRLARVSERCRDWVATAAATHLLGLAAADEPQLAVRDLSIGVGEPPGSLDGPGSARDAILDAAIELFAARGPASVSVRDLARRAGVNHGLVHRHFASKQALLAEAIEQGTATVLLAALTAGGFDLDTVVHMTHHGSPAARLIAGTLVDEIEITTVRRRFPVLRRLLAGYLDVPTGAGPGDLSDPRLAVAMAAALVLGSVIWGEHLRAVLGLDAHGIESAVADLARVLLALPGRAVP